MSRRERRRADDLLGRPGRTVDRDRRAADRFEVGRVRRIVDRAQSQSARAIRRVSRSIAATGSHAPVTQLGSSPARGCIAACTSAVARASRRTASSHVIVAARLTPQRRVARRMAPRRRRALDDQALEPVQRCEHPDERVHRSASSTCTRSHGRGVERGDLDLTSAPQGSRRSRRVGRAPARSRGAAAPPPPPSALSAADPSRSACSISQSSASSISLADALDDLRDPSTGCCRSRPGRRGSRSPPGPPRRGPARSSAAPGAMLPAATCGERRHVQVEDLEHVARGTRSRTAPR